MQNRTKKIIQQLAIKYNRSESLITKIVSSPYKKNAQLIDKMDLSSDEQPVFYHRNLGYFSISKRKLNQKRKRIDAKNDDQ